jgi:hypothetical protein
MKSTLIRRIRCFFGRHVFLQQIYTDGTLNVGCRYCSAIALTFRPKRWVQVREVFGNIDAFTITFNDPEDVPRVQRSQGTCCYPLYMGTAYQFIGAYRGSSTLDKQAIEQSKHDGKLAVDVRANTPKLSE